MFVVFDLDGTLALNDHRQHFLDGETKDWDGFFAACGGDQPHTPIINTLHTFAHVGCKVEIWSGRSAEVRQETKTWLMTHGIPVHFLKFMRAAGDFTPDDKLKEHWLSLGDKPDLVFDDRKKVVDMWRRNGIVCCQVAPGDF